LPISGRVIFLLTCQLGESYSKKKGESYSVWLNWMKFAQSNYESMRQHCIFVQIRITQIAPGHDYIGLDLSSVVYLCLDFGIWLTSWRWVTCIEFVRLIGRIVFGW
jgi:hypothetical protein